MSDARNDTAGSVVQGMIELLVNRTLELDDVALAAIARLRGRRVALEPRGTRARFVLTLCEDGIRLAGTGPADVTVRGAPSDVLRYLAASRSAAVAGELEIRGDVGLARELHDIFAAFDPDWEEAAARHIGDTPARKLGVMLRAVREAARDARSSFAASLGEYLRFERRAVPDRAEVERFVSAIDVLRDDVARLKVRLDRLARDGDR